MCHIPLHKFGYGKLVRSVLTLWIYWLFLCCVQRVSLLGVGGVFNSKKLSCIFSLARWCVFAIQIFAHSPLYCKAPFEAEEFYQDQWQCERAAWQRKRQCWTISNCIFKARKSKIKNVCKWWHVLHADIFMIWGLHIQVVFSMRLALATLIRITSSLISF